MIHNTLAQALALDLSPTEARRVRWRSSTADLADLEPLNHSLWVACAWDQRPPGGLAGGCDQRLGGALSRQLQEGKLSLAWGEVALVGAAQRLAGAHLLLLGLGVPGPMEPSRAAALGREIAERIHKLGYTQYALEPPWSDEVPRPEASQLAADFVAAHLQRRLAVLGPVGAITVTLVLPENVRFVDSQAGKPARPQRAGLRTRRHHQFRRSFFFRRRRKK